MTKPTVLLPVAIAALLAGWSLPMSAQSQRPTTTGAAARTPNAIITSAIEKARAQGDAGFADSALVTLARVPLDHPEIPSAAITNRTTLEKMRYQLVGKKAPAVTADYRIHWPRSGEGRFTTPRLRLIQFTAHWCGPCQTSYPALQAIAKEFGAAVDIILVTELYGQFEGKPAKPDAELRADSSYFAKVAPDFPVAVSRQPEPPVVPGVYYTENTRSYAVDALPQLVLIDDSNVVRRIFVGDAYQKTEQLRMAIAKLLGER